LIKQKPLDHLTHISFVPNMELVLPPAAVFQPAMKPTAVISIKKLLLFAVSFFFILYLLSFVFTRSAHAADCGPAASTADAINAINRCAISSKNGFDDKIFNLNQMAGTVCSLQRLLTGKCELQPEIDKVTQGTGALAASGKLVALLYSAPPASGVQYFAQKIQRFNPVQPAYAQSPPTGIGFDALQPVQRLWSAFRNMSYIGFVLVFIVIGFMVMFRSKISPQAVATIQDSLPRIVVALILVTFSYAIVGLMIDAMFVFLNVIINILKTQGLVTEKADIVFKESVFGVVLGMWNGAFGAVFESVGKMIQAVIGLPGGIDKVLGFFGGGIAGIIAGIAILFIMFRIFFMLLMSYVTIILLTIFAPFLLLFQALPGNNGAKEWFRQVGANIAVFPTVALMFILAGILGNIEQLGGGSNPVDPGKIGQFPLLSGGIEGSAVIKLIGLGILFMTPSAAKLVKERFGVKEGAGSQAFGAGAAALGAGAGAIGRPFGAAINPVRQSLSFQYGHGMAERIGRFTGKTDKTTTPTSDEEIAASQKH